MLKLWLKLGTLHVKYSYSNVSTLSVSEISWRSQDCHKVEVNQANLRLGILPDLKQWCLSCVYFIYIYKAAGSE